MLFPKALAFPSPKLFIFLSVGIQHSCSLLQPPCPTMEETNAIFRNLQLNTHRGDVAMNEILDISFMNCVRECRLRSHCEAVGYRRLYHVCRLYDGRYSSTPILENQPGSIYIDMDSLDTDQIYLGACSVTCEHGFRCNVTGSQNICHPSECPKPPDVANADLRIMGQAIGTRAKYICRDGYMTVGNPVITCKTNLNWTVPICKCVHAGCDNRWKMVFENSENGQATFGSKSQLIYSALKGASIRVSFGEDHFTSVQNVRKVSGNLCAQALFDITKDGDYSLASNASWVFRIICTTGDVHESVWYVGKHEIAADIKTTRRLQWFVRNTGFDDNLANSSISFNSNGNVVNGNVRDVISAVDNGADVMVSDTKFDNVEYDSGSGVVSGQALWHVSQTVTGDHVSFQPDAYWWFTIWSTTAKLDKSRWLVFQHQSKGHNNAYKAQEWYSDACWTLAYHHDANGDAIDGSLAFLRTAVENGQKIKLVKGSYSIVPDQVNILSGHIYGQFLNSVSKASIETFEENAYWVWQEVSTTGKVYTIRYFVGNSEENGGQKVSSSEGKWFVSTRIYRRILAHDENGVVTLGSKAGLISAIKNGSEVRIRLPTKSLYFEADNLKIVDKNVVAMHVRSVELEHIANGFQFMIPPFRNFKLVSSDGRMTTASWRVGLFKSTPETYEQSGVEWFVSG